ncbi:GNAT family N-acetyltransferase [Luteolibacter sp. LG18]|uniref:GNAT family N-acetyltransferase n=1 Tax=Luteolibacter sp. LG18 TaxID=2819286 RepID=UPI0030C71BC7
MDFLRLVYASTREEELALTDWADEQKGEFCRMQFEAQHAHYREHYAAADYQVIDCGDEPVGRLYVNRGTKEIRIMDLALLPAWRRQGIGTRLLTALRDEATAVGKRLSIHVEKFNPALNLYQRMGFVAEEDRGMYLLLVFSEG